MALNRNMSYTKVCSFACAKITVADRTFQFGGKQHLRLRPQFGLKFKTMPHVGKGLIM